VIVDLCAGALVLLLGWLGWRSGLLRQVAYWLALVGATVLATPLGAALEPELQARAGLAPGTLARYGALIVAWLLLFAVFALAGYFISRIVRDSKGAVGRLDAWGGALLGATKGAVLAAVLAAGLLLLHSPLLRAFPSLGPRLEGSQVLATLPVAQPALLSAWTWLNERLPAPGATAPSSSSPPAPKAAPKAAPRGPKAPPPAPKAAKPGA